MNNPEDVDLDLDDLHSLLVDRVSFLGDDLHGPISSGRFFCANLDISKGSTSKICPNDVMIFNRILSIRHLNRANDGKEAARLTAQILRGIAHLHENRIIHRDLKPENLLLSSKDLDAVIKITDFGLSKIFKAGEPELGYNAVGTPGYIAPEVLNLLDTGDPYSKEIDLWAVGVILYILLSGFPPFHGDDEEEIYDKITAGDWVFLAPYWDPVSKEAKDLIEKLLDLDPKKRLTAAQALAHPWIAHYETNSEAHLNETIVQLKKFNAKRKFKGAILAVKALSKLRRSFK